MKQLPSRNRYVAACFAAVLASASSVHAQQPAPPQPAAVQPAPAAPVLSPAAPSLPQAAPEAAGAAPQPASAESVHAIGALPHELSPWSMFLAADIVVKIVMIGLALASLVTWTIFFAKSAELTRARLRLRGALSRIKKATTLPEAQLALGKDKSVVAAMLRAAAYEAALSEDLTFDVGAKERVASSFADIIRADARAARHGTGLLATIGSTAPFVGLFGTVWGIMNSFIGISKAQTTNLAVVAPGIAEALLATAIGLIAAIPAVIIYNHFSRSTKAYLELVARASGIVSRLLSRDLERRHVGRSVSRAAE